VRNSSGRGRGHRSARLRRARAAAVITVMAGAALLAAACGGSPSSTGSGGSPSAGGSAHSPSAVAYSRCVRAHGVPDFPDPDGSGQISKEAVISAAQQVSASRFQAATAACQNLNPYQAAGTLSHPLTAQEQQDYLRAAACTRSHGITNFPDPTFSSGRVNVNIPSSIDTTSRQFTQAAQTCTKLIPAGLPYSRPGS
jgi:hypothetical protein